MGAITTTVALNERGFTFKSLCRLQYPTLTMSIKVFICLAASRSHTHAMTVNVGVVYLDIKKCRFTADTKKNK